MARIYTDAPNFSDCLTIGEAADILGVSAATLRNWDRSGKLKPRRHPQNGYRIYLHEDLQAVLKSAELPMLVNESLAPTIDWSRLKESEHFVQFYESESYLLESITGFVGAALRSGGSSLVVISADHCRDLHRRLVSDGFDIAAEEAAGRIVQRDAAQLLSEFMLDGMPNRRRFGESVGRIIAELSSSRRRIYAFGEMVALLWSAGNREGAIALERLWNEVARQFKFTLYCAYPMSAFTGEDGAFSLNRVCDCHTRVIPAESYSAIDNEDARLRAIGLLQQKAQALRAEIEHRREVERALLRREQELADFFENATVGLHQVGPDGTILWANQADYSLLGYAPEEYIGHSITQFHADAAVIADILRRLKQGEALVNYPAQLRCKNGSIKHVRINSNACFVNGEFLYTRCFTRDVTDQWQAEQALLDADRRKDEFLATLSHELRNPLAPIRNALELLDSHKSGDGERAEATRIIRRQVLQLTRLVEDLLDVSRISRGKIALRKVRVDIGKVIHSAIETSRPAMEQGRHRLDVELPESPHLLDADPARLAQVFSNLLNNAAKFTPPGGEIRVRVHRDERELVTSIRDNGIGIDRDDLACVFDMFRQADVSLEKSQGGLGIGLTLVRRLVELHGGTVKGHSEGSGKGSEFTVRLPIDAAATSDVSNRALASHAAATAKRRVLVVDDNEDSGDTLAMLLRVKGHDVHVARDGFDAIDKAAEVLPDVVLMDVGMPKLDGYEATRRIRETPHGRDMYIVALTGWGASTDVDQSLEAGCSAHLVKPVDFAALDQLLASVP